MNASQEPTTIFLAGDDLILDFHLDPPLPIDQPTLGVGIDNCMGVRVFSVTTLLSPTNWKCLSRPTRVRCIIPNITLAPGRYLMSLSVGTMHEPLMDALDHAVSFDVEATDYFGTGRLPDPSMGLVLARSQWGFYDS